MTNAEHPLIAHKAEIITLFPEAAAFYDPKCDSCTITKVASAIRPLIINRDVAALSFDIKAAVAIPAPEIAPVSDRIRSFADPGNIFMGDAITGRKTCLSCALKHLAQAFALTGEAIMGYPDHVDYALKHLKAAGGSVPPKMIKELTELAGALDGGRSLRHLELAQRAIGAMMRELGSPVPINYWKAVGHLAEASEECSTKYPEFANKVRVERLLLMADQSYSPPMVALLVELKELMEKDAAEGLRDGGEDKPAAGDGGQAGVGAGVSGAGGTAA